MLYLSQKKITIDELTQTLKASRFCRKTIANTIEFLLKDDLIRKNSDTSLTLNNKKQYGEAVIDRHPRGFGFGKNIPARNSRVAWKKDPFIAASRMNSARHEDRVLLKVIRTSRNGRSEAEVIGIIERTARKIAGILQVSGKTAIVFPDDHRFPETITIRTLTGINAKDGDAVVVRLDDRQNSHKKIHGTIVEVLGPAQNIAVRAQLVARKFSLPTSFSTKAKRQADRATPFPGPEKRSDLRDIVHYTIDSADAKDFDDAVAVVKTRNGFRLYVSIADVSAFIPAGSQLDKEAYQRGTSVYFPGTVLPMLPENLSNNLCSLISGQERMALTTIIDFSHNGKAGRTRFLRSVIKSHYRFTYDTINCILVGKDPAVRRAHKPFLTPLKWASELATACIEQRKKRNAIRFTMPEAEIKLKQNGMVASIQRSKRNFAHLLVEEFMIAANNAVAQALSNQHIQTLYRIHEQPDDERLNDLLSYAKSLGLEIPKEPNQQALYNKIIASVQDSSHEYIINTLLLRTMQQARYSDENKGHFGLALKQYCHFTSPIRRYPDLIVHRLLCRLIENQEEKPLKKKIGPVSSLRETGLHLSERERTAIASEREMADRLKMAFMANKRGESFTGVISAVSDTVIFVELIEHFVSGIIPLAHINDDYYLLDQKRHRLVGDITGKTYQIGDTITITVTDIDQQRKKILFRPVEK